jgi:Tol biopolymer transport system component
MDQQSWLRDVTAMLQRGDVAGAKREISAELKRSPQNADAWYLSSFLLNDPQRQKQVLERALSYDPGHEQARKRLDALGGSPKTAPPQTAGRRSLFVLALVGAGLGLVLGGAALLLLQSGQRAPAAIVLADTPTTAATRIPAETAEPTITLRATRTFRPTSTRPSPTPTLVPLEASLPIVYVSRDDKKYDIYKMTSDGKNQHRLTDTGDNFQPSWSPDRGRIVFGSGRDGNAELYVMNADGSNVRRLTNNTMRDIDPMWSPDGQFIVFSSERDDEKFEIYTMRPDGNDVRRLTFNTVYDGYPAWSPDSKRLAFITSGQSSNAVFVMDSDGKNQKAIPGTDISPLSPSWSSDGRWIAYSSAFNPGLFITDLEGKNKRTINDVNHGGRVGWSPDSNYILYVGGVEQDAEVFVMTVEGMERRSLTNNANYDSYPGWPPFAGPVQVVAAQPTATPGASSTRSRRRASPTPQATLTPTLALKARIAFTSHRDRNAEIYMANSDGSDAVRLTMDSADDTSPTWSPDGTKIAFLSARNGISKLYTVNADGSGARVITTNKDVELSPAWSPDGKRIAFAARLDGNTFDIVVIDSDGKNQQVLTRNRIDDMDPSWSPDGKYIIYSTGAQDGGILVIMDADGSNPRQVKTDSRQRASRPKWSPDGRRIAYLAIFPGVSKFTLHVIDVDGTNEQEITQNLIYGTVLSWTSDSKSLLYASGTYNQDNPMLVVEAESGAIPASLPLQGMHPAIQPSGTPPVELAALPTVTIAPTFAIKPGKLVVSVAGENSMRLYTMNVDGSNRVDLKVDGNYPKFSPDSKRIIYETRTGRIGIVNADGSAAKELTDFSSNNPSWSPNGKQILFHGSRAGSTNLYLVNADGSGLRRLSTQDGFNGEFSPDGKQIVFCALGSRGYIQAFVMNADGTDLRLLAQRHAVLPTWSRDGKQIAYVDRDGDTPGFYVITVGESEPRLIAPITEATNQIGNSVAWSPDGRYLMIATSRDRQTDLFIVKSDGSEIRQLTDDPAQEIALDWH